MEAKTQSRPLTGTNTERAYTNFLFKVWFVSASVFLFVFVRGIHGAQAASLYFSPSSGAYRVGQTFSVTVGVSSADQAMNAASAAISFPADQLEVMSLSKAGSIIALWAQEPTFSNAAGTVSFEGVVFNPGYTGGVGKLIGIQFKTKGIGNAPLGFSSGSVLANDGAGTNIIAGLGSARFSIGVPVEGPAAEEATTPSALEAVGVPIAPKVSSSTHPDPNKWYANRNPVFTLAGVNRGINGVNVLADRYPDTNPGTRSDGLFSTYEYKEVDEGVWYFHVRLHSAAGWGAISHFRFQIDATPPLPFAIKFPEGKETGNPTPPVVFATSDAVSGMAYYKVRVGDKEAAKVPPEAVASGKPYALPAQDPGAHTIVVQAFDHAGNVTTASEEFTVRSLNPPVITDYPKELFEGEIFRVAGETYPQAAIILTVVSEAGKVETEEVKSGEDGAFIAIWPRRLKNGIYTLTGQVIDAQGAKSGPSESLTMAVRQRMVLRFGALAVDYLSVLVTLVSLLALLVAILILAWYRFTRFREKMRKEVRDVEDVLHQGFNRLRQDIRAHVTLLEKVQKKRALTAEEKKIIKRLKDDLDATEQMVNKEVQEVEGEIK